jgi:transposase-like protein
MRHWLRGPHSADPDPTPLAQRRPPRMDHGVGGWKDSQFSHRTARIILARIEAGESVQSLLDDPAMPSKRTLYDWINDWPDFGDAWREMRADQAAARRQAVERRRAERAQDEAARTRARGRTKAGRRRRKPGRKTTYSEDLTLVICMRLEWGATLRQALAAAGVGSPSTFYRWLRDHPALRESYVIATRERDRDLRIRSDMTAMCMDWRKGWTHLRGHKTEIDRLEGRRGALAPDVWRWD